MDISERKTQEVKNLSSFYDEWVDIRNKLIELPKCSGLEAELSKLIKSLRRPFSVAVLGRIKTGKSTLINALIGKNLSLIGIKETTALINRICISENADSSAYLQYKVYWKEGLPPESRDIKTLNEWNNDTINADKQDLPEFLELYANVEGVKDFHIIDTPGTGSIFTQRDEIARQFIKGHGANAMIYVLSHTGHDSDKNQLADYRNYMDRFGINSQDYCIAVLQKWDEVFWNSGSQQAIDVVIEDVQAALKDYVYRVIPVIAPLGLLSHPKNQGDDSKQVNKSFWEDCLECLSQYRTTEALCADLRYSEKWDEVAGRRDLRLNAENADVPWNCFRLMLRELKKHNGGVGFQKGEEEEARKYVYRISGIGELERVVMERFWRNAELLWNAQMSNRADKVMNKIKQNVYASMEYNNMAVQHLGVLIDDSALHGRYKTSISFLSDYRMTLQNELNNCNDILTSISEKSYDLLATQFRMSQELQISDALSGENAFFKTALENAAISRGDKNPEELTTFVQELFRTAAGGIDELHETHISRLVPLLIVLANAPDAKVRRVASYLKSLTVPFCVHD